MSNLGDVLSESSVTQTHHRRGSRGGVSSRRKLWGLGSRRIFEKKGYFDVIGSDFARVQSHLIQLNF